MLVVPLDPVQHIALLSVLHHQAQCLRVYVDKRLLVLHDVHVFDRGEEPDLVQCVLLVFFIEVGYLDFL